MRQSTCLIAASVGHKSKMIAIMQESPAKYRLGACWGQMQLLQGMLQATSNLHGSQALCGVWRA